jgi:hypothetical protein
MSRLTEREIARRLAEPLDEEPPAGLLEKIKSEIPPVIPIGNVRLFPVPSPEPRRQRWLIAASLAVAVIGGLVTWKVLMIRPQPVEEVEAPPAVISQAERIDLGSAPPPPAVPAPPADTSIPSGPPPELHRQVESLSYLSGADEERRPSPSVQPMAAPEPQELKDEAVEGGVEGGVPGGVAGGVPAGVPAQDAPLRVGAGRQETAAKPKVMATTGGTTGGNAEDRLSTFGLDVDTGSYTVARGNLEDGNLPDPDSIRVEEFVNFFDYGDAPPTRDDFALSAEGAPTPFAGPGYRLLRFNVRARQIRPEPVEELEGTLETIAKDAKAQVAFNPEVVARWRLLGYENRDIADEKLRDGSVDAGEIGAGHSVTALYEVELKPGAAADRPVANLHLRWRSEQTGRVREEEKLLRVSQLAASWEQATPALRLASVVAELAEILKGSFWARGSSLDELYRLAQRVSGEQGESRRAPDVTGLVSLIGKAARLKEH